MTGRLLHPVLDPTPQTFRAKRGRGATPRRLLLPAALAAAAMIASACSRLETAAPLTRGAVVMDFRVPRSIAEKEFQVKGWWLGAHTVFQNAGAGKVFADVLALQLHHLDYVEQHSREDVKFYMAGKRLLLEKKFKNRTDEEYARMLSEVSPVDYGLDLGVDQVVTGRLIECFTSEHRTIHTWYSQIKVQVEVWDMKSARVVWTRTFFDRSHFASQSIAMQKVAVRIVKALDRDFYRKAKP
jgi:hypothetical protein